MLKTILTLTLSALILPLSAIAGDAPRWERTRDLWDQIGGSATSFEFAGGQLTLQRGENEPSAVLTKGDYENFEMSFEFLLSNWCESGIFIHAPRNGATNAGMEIALASWEYEKNGKNVAGAITGEQEPLVLVEQKPFVWHSFAMVMDWPRLKVSINDVVVQDLDLSTHPTLQHKLRTGAIGIQNNGYGASFRKVTITPLKDKQKSKALFNGKNLNGWKVVEGEAHWNVKSRKRKLADKTDVQVGILSSANGDGYLQHQELYENFRLRMYVRTSPIANGGVFFRWLPKSMEDRGYEIQILDNPFTDNPTGSIYGFARGNDLALSPGEWQLLQIHVDGPKVKTFIDGILSAEYDSLEKVRPGHIALQSHRTRAKIEYKEIILEQD